jgi:reactive intermediate/imine deaminase
MAKSNIENFLSKNAPNPGGAYSHGVVANGFLYTCGMGPANPLTNKVEVEGIEEQTRQVLKNLQAILAEKGATLDQVVKVTTHLQHLNRDFAVYNKIYQEFFTAPFPVRTTVGSDLIDILVEIDFVVAL